MSRDNQYMLFTDRREPFKDDFTWGDVQVALDRQDPALVIAALRELNWHHPVLLVYRPEGEDRWSYTTLNRSEPCDDTEPRWRN